MANRAHGTSGVIGGGAVSPPRIILYVSAGDVLNNTADSLLGYYQRTEQIIHVPCPAAIDEQTFDMAIRHEATHHYLWQVFGRLPAWLDEGLSTYMEVPADPDGMRINTLRQNEFIDMLKWGVVPPLKQLLALDVASRRVSHAYAAYWALAFALLHHPDVMQQAARRQLLLRSMALSEQGADAINHSLLSGLRREEEDLVSWQLRWHRQLWDAHFR